MTATLGESEVAYRPNPAWAEYIRRIVDAAPPLSPAQRSRLAVLLMPAPRTGSEDPPPPS